MTTEHKPDPEFVEYMENQVKNAFLSAATVMQMERVFIDQREKYEAKLQAAREQEGGEAVRHDWVDCPVCGEPDMRRTVHEREQTLIHCCNANCLSNGGTNSLACNFPPQSQGVPEVATDGMLAEGVQALIRGLKSFPGNYTQVVSNIWEDMAAEIATPSAPQSDEWVRCDKQQLKAISNNLQYAGFNLCDDFDFARVQGTKWRTVESTCPETSLLIAIRDLSELIGEPVPQPPEQGDGV